MDVLYRGGRPLSGTVWWLKQISLGCCRQPIKLRSANTLEINSPTGNPPANTSQSRRHTHARI